MVGSELPKLMTWVQSRVLDSVSHPAPLLEMRNSQTAHQFLNLICSNLSAGPWSNGMTLPLQGRRRSSIPQALFSKRAWDYPKRKIAASRLYQKENLRGPTTLPALSFSVQNLKKRKRMQVSKRKKKLLKERKTFFIKGSWSSPE